MFRRQSWLTCAMALGVVVAASGCGATQKSDVNQTPPASAGSKADQPAPTAADDSAPGLKELSKADRALAEKQKTCPVTDEPLGGMGKPVKLTVKGQVVFLCCEGCRAEFDKNQDKYLKAGSL